MSFFKSTYFILAAIQFLVSFPSTATDKSLFDLQGDGQLSQVKFPFNYYERQEGDRLTLIHQGGYKVYDIGTNANDVAVIGPLKPCIGIAVTDSEKLITFHKHSSSSLSSMEKVIRENLNLSIQENLYARIYTAKDDVKWKEENRQAMHGGKTHLEEVKAMKDFLNQKIGIIRDHIPADLKNLRDKSGKTIHADHSLGKYEIAELCVAVRLNEVFELSGRKKQIKFSSIDPYTEDVFGYKGTQVTVAEYVGPNLVQLQQAHPSIDFTKQFVSYDKIPELYFQQSGGQKDGYQMQRGVCQNRLEWEENQLYLKHFGKPEAQLFAVGEKAYDSLDFYPI